MFKLTCPYCNADCTFHIRAQSREYRFDHCILECSGCGRQVYARVRYDWNKTRPYRRGDPIDVQIYPPAEAPSDERVPGPISAFYQEAVRAFNSGCYRACLLLCHRVLDEVCTSRMIGGKSLRARMDALAKSGQVPKELVDRFRRAGLLASDLGVLLRNVGAADSELALHFTEELLFKVYVKRPGSIKVGT